AAVTVAPAQVEEPEADAVFTRPAGYVSVKATPVTAAAFGLVSVTVSTLVPLVPMEPGVNASATVRPESTVSVAAAGAVLAPALPEVSAPAAIVFTGAPAAAAVTFTVTVHEPAAGMVAPASATLAPLLAAVTLPPTQVVAPEAEAVLVMPAGYASVNAAPVTATAFALESVMVR